MTFRLKSLQSRLNGSGGPPTVMKFSDFILEFLFKLHNEFYDLFVLGIITSTPFCSFILKNNLRL